MNKPQPIETLAKRLDVDPDLIYKAYRFDRPLHDHRIYRKDITPEERKRLNLSQNTRYLWWAEKLVTLPESQVVARNTNPEPRGLGEESSVPEDLFRAAREVVATDGEPTALSRLAKSLLRYAAPNGNGHH